MKNKKIVALLVLLIILVISGIVMLNVKGLNYNLMYSDNTRIDLYIGFNYDQTKVTEIVQEIFPEQEKYIQVSGVANDTLTLTVKEITEEQKETFVQKINEAYETSLTTGDLDIVNNAQIKIWDILNKYIYKIALALSIILIYLIIRYKNLGIWKVASYTLISILTIQLIAISIIAITQIPVSRIVIPILLGIFIINIIAITSIFEKMTYNNK